MGDLSRVGSRVRINQLPRLIQPGHPSGIGRMSTNERIESKQAHQATEPAQATPNSPTGGEHHRGEGPHVVVKGQNICVKGTRRSERAPAAKDA